MRSDGAHQVVGLLGCRVVELSKVESIYHCTSLAAQYSDEVRLFILIYLDLERDPLKVKPEARFGQATLWCLRIEPIVLPHFSLAGRMSIMTSMTLLGVGI